MGSRVGGLGTASLPADKALAGCLAFWTVSRLSEDTDSADIVSSWAKKKKSICSQGYPNGQCKSEAGFMISAAPG
ncbi:hypothetical protein NQ317_016292 [Molorchus minor]|uniref:Uncharacterized protein n=1 Tax=Molorchus minor TaxID=1323400 RepID=A0ABQ9IUL2_9CUCU|nr:hypothetical protein NQ317_016292 [Molorchus minor]